MDNSKENTNRLGPVKNNSHNWKTDEDQQCFCECEEVQDMDLPLRCKLCPEMCSIDEMWRTNGKVIDVALH
ncbi:hypothetical protein Trydic_g19281 [Trypoxylus dichotomus]